MINQGQREQELKKEKKASKIFFGVAKMAGTSVGLFLLSLIAPLIYETAATDGMQDLFLKYSLLMIGYVVVMVLVYLFLRPYIFFMNGIMQYLFLPSVVILFAYEAYNIIME